MNLGIAIFVVKDKLTKICIISHEMFVITLDCIRDYDFGEFFRVLEKRFFGGFLAP